MESMRVTVPEGTSGNVEIRRVVAGKQSLRDLIHCSSRSVPEGFALTSLYRDGDLWMSDTPAERKDHLPMVFKAHEIGAKSALINGLGLGMIVQALLMGPVQHIDVVELDTDVINLVGGHYQRMAEELGKTVVIHHADAYTITWPREARWDVAWSDIWQHICVDNLPEMTRLSRKYARRVKWHGMWMREELKARRKSDQAYARRRTWLSI